MIQLLFIASLAGIGLGMLWTRAEPLKDLHDWVIIRADRCHTWAVTRKWRISRMIWVYPFWHFKGIIGCEDCFAPYLAAGLALALGLKWYSLLAMPMAYAIYHLLLEGRKIAR